MVLVYRVSLWVYRNLVRIAALFYPKAKEFLQGRVDLFDILDRELSQSTEPKIWVHVSSLGEYEQGRPVIERLSEEFKHYSIVLTFFSPSGYNVVKRKNQYRHVYYLPLDGKRNAQRFVSLVKPMIAIFIKYDFWYFYLKTLIDQEVPIFFVSTAFHESSLTQRSLNNFFKPVFSKVSHFFVADPKSAKVLNESGITAVTTSGDTRFDRVVSRSTTPFTHAGVESFKGAKPLIILGSMWPTDMGVIDPLIPWLSIRFKILIAPHQVTEPELSIYMKYKGVRRFTHGESDNSNILVLDTIGLLADLYRYADIAIMGGAFRGALHNILEPASYGVPVLFGEHENNELFPEAGELIGAGGAFTFAGTGALQKELEKLLDPKARKAAGDSARRYVASKTGATDIVMSHLTKYL